MVKKCYHDNMDRFGQPVWNLHFLVQANLLFLSGATSHTLAFHPTVSTQQESSMFPIIRVRRDARILARKLRLSLAAPEDTWKIGTDDEGRPTLSNAGVRIVLVPRVVRLFDAIHVYCDDAEIWLPFLARLRLRAAARLRLIQDASDSWQDSNLKKPRASRRRTKPAA
jgi:hypothetical protein